MVLAVHWTDDMLSAVLIASAIMVPLNLLFLHTLICMEEKVSSWQELSFLALGIRNISFIDTGNYWLIVLAISTGLIFLAMMYGPQAAFFTELFSTEVRYSGATLGYQFGAILGGAFAPQLLLSFGLILVLFGYRFILLLLLLTLLSVMALTETYKSNLSNTD